MTLDLTLAETGSKMEMQFLPNSTTWEHVRAVILQGDWLKSQRSYAGVKLVTKGTECDYKATLAFVMAGEDHWQVFPPQLT